MYPSIESHQNKINSFDHITKHNTENKRMVGRGGGSNKYFECHKLFYIIEEYTNRKCLVLLIFLCQIFVINS